MRLSGRARRSNGATLIDSAMDRRLACRYRATTRDVILCITDPGSMAEYPAELENVSMQGCLVKSRRNPRVRLGDRVWLKVPGDLSTPVIESIVVSAVKPFLGRCVVRMRFVQPLTYLVFKRLVYGQEGIDLNRRERPDFENDQFWK